MRDPRTSTAGSIARDALVGAAAGLAGTWLMDQVTTYLYERESDRAREDEDRARGGRTAYGIAAERIAEAVGNPLSDEQRTRAGTMVHWTLGATAGALYAILRGRLPGADLAGGLAFGTAFWLVMDEGANTLLGLTPPPQAFPLETHARGMAGHLVLGAATETILRGVDAVT